MRSAFLPTLCATLAAASPYLSGRDTCPGLTNPNYTGFTVNPPPTKQYICGKHGTIAKPAQLNTLPSCTATSLDSCRDSCLGQPRCLSFQYDTATLTCSLYAKPLNQQGFTWTPKKQANPMFYARACFYQAYTAEYLDNGDFEDGYDSATEESNIDSIHWYLGPQDSGANVPYVGPTQQNYAQSPGWTLEASCAGDNSNPPCSFIIYQDISGPISKGAYTLTFQATANYYPGQDPTKGVTISPSFNGAPPSAGDTQDQPCQEGIVCPYSDYQHAQFTNYTAQWYSSGGLSTSRISFDVNLGTGWSMGFDNISFKWTGSQLSASAPAPAPARGRSVT